MKTEIAKIADDVSVLLGEPLLPECEPGDAPFPGLALRVRGLLPAVLGRLLQETQRHLLSGWKELPRTLTVDDNGIGTLSLPDDYLMLGNVRVSHWIRAVEEPAPPDSFKRALQSSEHEGIRGNSDRPVAVETITGNGIRCLKLYSCRRDSAIVEGSYLPVPAVSDGQVDIPPVLYPELIQEIARKILED